jgi:hypothetical protein
MYDNKTNHIIIILIIKKQQSKMFYIGLQNASCLKIKGGRRGRDLMVVVYTTTCGISAYYD